ncbi:MAG: divalent-cation tolerance protein CutA [Bacteroidota bacterium]
MFLLFYVTYPDEATAQRIGQQLVRERLAAGTNCLPIKSSYWWKEAVVEEGEWVGILKTQLAGEAALEQRIEALHPYEVPCIVRTEVRANAAYEKWIVDQTQPPKKL